jgi:NAD(P)-dependent dehydrogenase (short-subunit alcohol dehydrogenase family)
MASFAGRKAIVTGAGGGMGLAIVHALATAGAEVVAVDVKAPPEALDGVVEYQRGDVTDPDFVDAVVETARTSSGSGNVEMVVNAAGVGWFNEPGLPPPPFVDGSIVDIDLAAWNRVIEINLTAPMLLSRAVLPIMREHGGGAFVHIGSIAGLRVSDGPLDAYQVSKAGLISLSRGIATAWGQYGIRSNTVNPGAVMTPMLQGLYSLDPTREPAMAARAPLGRVGQVGDIAGAVTYLLSDEAAFVTGTDMVVDGGLLAML